MNYSIQYFHTDIIHLQSIGRLNKLFKLFFPLENYFHFSWQTLLYIPFVLQTFSNVKHRSCVFWQIGSFSQQKSLWECTPQLAPLLSLLSVLLPPPPSCSHCFLLPCFFQEYSFLSLTCYSAKISFKHTTKF